MVLKGTKEYLIIIINIGTAYHRMKEHHSDHFDKMKLVAKGLIEKKIFLRPEDEIGIFVMGSEVTSNTDNIDHVKVLKMETPSWDQVRFIMNLHCTDKITNWISVVKMAAHYLNHECVNGKTKTIVSLSDFKAHTDAINQSSIDNIVKILMKDNIQFLCIGEELVDRNVDKSITAGFDCILNICKKVNGQYMTVDDAITDLSIYRRNILKVYTWKCIMNVYSLAIPIIAYAKVKKECIVPSWKVIKKGQKYVKKVGKPIRSRRTDQKSANDEKDTVAGYAYGDKLVPFTVEDKNIMTYDSGPKSFIVYCFVKRQAVGIENWGGDGTRIIVPENKHATEMFFSLMQSMLNDNVVAIVRKVHCRQSTPKMVALFPRVGNHGEPWCFVEIELPYPEDRFSIQSGPLITILRQLPESQDDLIEGLLTVIQLTSDEKSDSRTEDAIYLPGCAVNPATQHVFSALVARALHSRENLPPMNEYLARCLKRPPAIAKNSLIHLFWLRKMFNLKGQLMCKREFYSYEVTDH